jgi:hypothetical protein
MLTEIIFESWHVLVEAAPFVLLGFFVAGLLKAYVPDAFMAKHLGGKGPGPVVKAALFGIPLPLCSCGVLPAALGLRRQGASKGAATSFMISTPETGVDSIAVTYALLDPIMTVIRPVGAFFTSIVAGLLVNMGPAEEEKPEPLENLVHSGCGCSSGCCDDEPKKAGSWQRFRGGMDYAFGEMIADIGKWLIIGVVLAGIIAALIPDGFIENNIGHGLLPLFIMLLVGLPLYVCATASTPIAASLVLKGLSPGAALVFLLAGPATNGATLTVMFKALGRRAAFAYLFAIAVCSIALGWLTDRLYVGLGLDITAVLSDVDEAVPEWLGTASAIALLLLIAWNMLPNRRHSHDCC